MTDSVRDSDTGEGEVVSDCPHEDIKTRASINNSDLSIVIMPILSIYPDPGLSTVRIREDYPRSVSWMITHNKEPRFTRTDPELPIKLLLMLSVAPR